MKKKKQKKWVKKRYAIIQTLAKFLLNGYIKCKYHIKIEKCKDKRQRLILYNHQTPFDQFFVALGYKKSIYYLASEDIFSNGFISKLLRFAVNPIPIKKSTQDIRAVINCVQVAKEGGCIAIAPEGNRTYSGTTEHIGFAIVKLVKTIRLPLTFFRIEGGYGIAPRWSDDVRKGKMRAFSSKTIEPEEYLKLSDNELFNVIKNELFVDENLIGGIYKSKVKAEYLERAIYVCPYCGLAEFYSDKDTVKCLRCGREIIYGENKKLSGKDIDFPFSTVKEWYDYQNEFVLSLNIDDFMNKPYFSDKADLFEVQIYKKKKLIKENVELFGFANKFILDGDVLSFEDVNAVAVLGRNKLNIYYKEKVYQIKGDKRFNALKYVNIFYKWEGLKKEINNGKFLGL